MMTFFYKGTIQLTKIDSVDLRISPSSVHNHITGAMNYSRKNVRMIPESRNSKEKKQARYDFVKKLLTEKIDFMKDCVFIDESGFKKGNLQRRGYSKRGVPCVIEVSDSPGVNQSIIGCMSREGLLFLSRHAPREDILDHHDQIGSKRKRKDQHYGTTSTHFRDFIQDLLKVMQELKLENKYIVMDNCSIHHGDGSEDLIAQSGHTLLFLLPRAPFLNPIEKIWKQIKDEVHRHPLTSNDDLIERIEKAAKRVSGKNCRGYIRNAMTFFDACLEKEDIYYDE